MSPTSLTNPLLRWLSQGIILLPALFAAGIFFVPRLFVWLYLGSAVSLWLAVFLFHRASGSWRDGFVFFGFLALFLLFGEGLLLFVASGWHSVLIFMLLMGMLWLSVHIHTTLHADPLHHRRSGFQHLLAVLLFLNLLFVALDGTYLRIFLRTEFWLAALGVMLGTGLVALLYLIFFAPLSVERVLGVFLAMLLAIEFFWVLHIVPTNPVVVSSIFTFVLFAFLTTYRGFLDFTLRVREVVISLTLGATGLVGVILTARW